MEQGCILVVDDDPSVARMIAQVLRRAGYSVLCAANGAEALQIFGHHEAEIDLVVCDVVMPRMGGLQLVEQLRAKRPDLPVLFISAYLHTAPVRDLVIQRGICFLAKPFQIGKLLALTRNLLAGRTSSTAGR